VFAGAKIDGAEDERDLGWTGEGAEDEQILGSLIAHGETSDGAVASMDHDVAAGIRPLLAGGILEIEGVRIIHPYGEVIPAVGIQIFHAVETLGHLPVALAEFRAQRAARAKNGIGADESKGCALRIGSIYIQPALLLEREQGEQRGRISDAGQGEVGMLPIPYDVSILLDSRIDVVLVHPVLPEFSAKLPHLISGLQNGCDDEESNSDGE